LCCRARALSVSVCRAPSRVRCAGQSPPLTVRDKRLVDTVRWRSSVSCPVLPRVRRVLQVDSAHRGRVLGVVRGQDCSVMHRIRFAYGPVLSHFDSDSVHLLVGLDSLRVQKLFTCTRPVAQTSVRPAGFRPESSGTTCLIRTKGAIQRGGQDRLAASKWMPHGDAASVPAIVSVASRPGDDAARGVVAHFAGLVVASDTFAVNALGDAFRHVGKRAPLGQVDAP